MHAILGENGAGKSTFIKVLGGSVIPDAGTIEVDGAAFAPNGPAQAAAAGIEVAYQELSLLGDLTVAENLWMQRMRPHRSRLLRRRDLRARTMEVYERYDVPPIDPDVKVRSLSLAEKQVVEVASAIATDPRVLVLDEATASLPARETDWVIGLARRLAEQGTLVLFISHRLPEIRRVADRVTVFRAGANVLSAPVGALSDDEMVEAMLGRKPARLYPPQTVPPTARVALSVRGLSVRDRLAPTDLDVREGEIVGIGGLQGQGQSALLAALFGLEPAKGTIATGERTLRLRNPRDAMRAGISLIPEDRRNEGLLVTKSVRDNLVLPVLSRLTRGGIIDGDREDALVASAIERLAIRTPSADVAVQTLSGGNQQKVVLAKSLIGDARVLLFHDVTRGIDVGTKAQIFTLARELTAAGHAIVFYSSDNQELVHMCDRVLVLSHGQVAAELAGAQLTEANIVRASFALEPTLAAAEDAHLVEAEER